MASVITTGSTQASGGTNLGGKSVWAARLIGGTPSQAEPKNIGFGQGNPNGTRITALVTDMALAGEVVSQTNRLAGTSSAVTTAGGNYLDTYQVQGTLTAAGALAIVEAALFDTNAYPAQTTVATQGVLSGTGTGTFTITSATGFPTAATLYQIDQEVFTATISGTTVTITARGSNGSTAVSHANGSTFTVASPTGTGGGGIMVAKGDFAVINLSTNDTLQLTAKVQFT